MQPPRMKIGVYGPDGVGLAVAGALSRAGHDIDFGASTSNIAQYDLVLLAVPDSRVPEAAKLLAPHVQPKQIVMHLAAEHGVEALESLDCVTIAAHPTAPLMLDECVWAVTTDDELASTIAELLILEIGGNVITIAPKDRADYARAVSYGDLVDAVIQDAIDGLSQPAATAALAAIKSHRSGPLSVDDAARLSTFSESISDPARARAYRELVRRAAEISAAHNAELWALRGDL